MRGIRLTALAAVLLMGAAPVAYGQAGDADRFGQQQRFDQQQQQQFGQPGRTGQQFGQIQRGRMGQAAEEDRLRDALREAGFSRVRILDTAYMVSARTPDGRNVVMLVDPPARMAQQRMDQQRMGRHRMGQQRMGQQRMEQPWGQQQFDQDRDVTGALQHREMIRDMDMDRAAAGRLPEQAVRQVLEMRGMTDVEDLRREDLHFVGTADWYGEEVEFRIDAQTGEVLQPARMERAQIRAKLQDEGWRDVRDVERSGDTFFATATRDGDDYDLMLDSRTGNILAHRDLS
jgi:hypothetical protein